MINRKSVVIGFIISIVLALILGSFSAIGPLIAVLLGAIFATFLANRENQLKVVESALHGILVGIFTGVAQILIIYVRSGFSEKVAGILIIAALVLIGAYIIIGALGGIVGTLLQLKLGKSDYQTEDQYGELKDQHKSKDQTKSVKDDAKTDSVKDDAKTDSVKDNAEK